MDVDRVATLAKALGHPDRVRLLDQLAAVPELSPRAFSDATGVPLGTASYHVRVLRAAGLIEATHEEQRRGAMEHFYALTDAGKTARAWAQKVPS